MKKNMYLMLAFILAFIVGMPIVQLSVGLVAMETHAAPHPHRFIAPIEPVQERADFAEWIPVGTAEELDAIRGNLSGKFYLTADIDLAGMEWVPIGDNFVPFSGMFDGQGHIIRNLTITREIINEWRDGEGAAQYYGLFGNTTNFGWNSYTRSSIKNVGLENVNISVEWLQFDSYGGSDRLWMGGIAGTARYIENSFVTGSIRLYGSPGIYTTYLNVGGIAGGLNQSVVASYNLSEIDVELIAPQSARGSHRLNVGGIVGDMWLYHNVTNSFNAGDIFGMIGGGTTEPHVYLGGIVGGGYPNVENVFNLGFIEAVAIAFDSRTERELPRGSSLLTSARAYASGISNFSRLNRIGKSFNFGNINSTASGNGANDRASEAVSSGINSELSGARVFNSVNLGNVESTHHSFAIAVPPDMMSYEMWPNTTRRQEMGGTLENTFVRSDYSGIRYGNTIIMPDNAFATQGFWEERVGFDFENIWEMSPHGYPVFIGMSDIAVRNTGNVQPPAPPHEPEIPRAVYRIPLNDYVVSAGGDFGIPRAIENGAFHNGADITSHTSNEVFAAADGYIIMIRNGDRRHIPGESNVGYTIIARHNGFWAEYSHVVPHLRFLEEAGHPGPDRYSSLQVPIIAGQSLGWLSTPENTAGYPFGTHLHFGIRDASLGRWDESRNWWDGSSGGRYLTREALDNQGYVDPIPFIYAR